MHLFEVKTMATQQKCAYSAFLPTFFDKFGGSYPPRSVFHNWPTCFQIYQDVCLEMPEKLYTLNSSEKFREWMTEELSGVDLLKVGEAITSLINTECIPVLTGYLACLSYLAHAYRWGTVPTTSLERERSTLEFPDCLWDPFKKVNDYFGLPYRGNHFSLMACNAIFDKNGSPVGMKFKWNFDPEIAYQESNFMLLMAKAECEVPPILGAFGEYLDLLQTFTTADDRSDVEQQMIEKVYLAKGHLSALLKQANKIMHDSFISREVFAPHIQGMIAWGLSTDVGSSAAENLIFQALNVFCDMEGASEMSRFGMKTRKSIPDTSRLLLKKLEESTKGNLFPTEKLIQAKADLITVFYAFILGHARKVPDYIAKSPMTASRFLLKDLVSNFKRKMKERCDEVLFVRNKALGRSADNAINGSGIEKTFAWSWSKALFYCRKALVMRSNCRLPIWNYSHLLIFAFLCLLCPVIFL
ncbi:uncharacterized protein LOC106178242 isoform X1 [Lingula anatina]|uniref:Uncharacterized protein LOC106178242 isoform X1 n=2 Tax=Lingula anatina TaxID=7574 RepID=A0A1S3K317_LINAN|nr:uncharacterized protein LOC106178242 isoform X1 [Lingula anatina]|eukprot:XP_013416809.1 uncharacterized protein LOC106178242 isoform X1 [Lingula anatina]